MAESQTKPYLLVVDEEIVFKGRPGRVDLLCRVRVFRGNERNPMLLVSRVDDSDPLVNVERIATAAMRHYLDCDPAFFTVVQDHGNFHEIRFGIATHRFLADGKRRQVTRGIIEMALGQKLDELP